MDGNYTKIDVRGREGATLREKWRDGPLGYLGILEAGFPNFFMILGPNGPFTNLPPSIEVQVEWIADVIAYTEVRAARSRPGYVGSSLVSLVMGVSKHARKGLDATTPGGGHTGVLGTKAKIRPEPKGVCLIIAP